MLNWAMMKNPLNWLTIALMVIIFGIAADILLGQFTPHSQQE
jgi:hypothetical protein